MPLSNARELSGLFEESSTLDSHAGQTGAAPGVKKI
jgi:hypothetical protein